MATHFSSGSSCSVTLESNGSGKSLMDEPLGMTNEMSQLVESSFPTVDAITGAVMEIGVAVELPLEI